MPIYMYEFAYTAESWAAQLKKPTDRIKTVGKAVVEAAGGKLVGSWYAFGDFDAVLILDLPDNEAMASVALAVGSGGALRSSRTTALMTGAEGVAAMKKAASLGASYKPAR